MAATIAAARAAGLIETGLFLPAAAVPGGRAGVAAAAAAVVISQTEEIHEDPALQTLYFMRNQCCEFQIPLL